MKLPQSVDVGPYVYTYEYKKTHWVDDERKYQGYCDVEGQVLKLGTKWTDGRDKSPHDLFQLIIHETVHAINETWVLGLSENTVERLSNGLLQAFNSWEIKLEDSTMEEIKGE